MLGVTLVLWSVASLGLSAKCPGFPDVECREPNNCRKQSKDWALQPLPISGYAVFQIKVPQFRRQRTKEIVIGLFGSIVPNATYNFGQFAAGGIKVGGKVYRYQGTPFHRIQKNELMFGGDVRNKDGSGHLTATGAFSQKPDNFYISNYGKGWVGMKELGAEFNHNISSQFFISLTNDRKALHVLNQYPILHLGKVVKGFGLIDRINNRADMRFVNGAIPLDKKKDAFGQPLLRPKGGDIVITKSSYVDLQTGIKRGYPKYTFNRPAKGCLSGRWPRK